MKRQTVHFLAFFSLLLFFTLSFAAVPRLINYQGILTDTEQIPIDGPHDLTFMIYPDSVTTTAYWTEVHNSVDIDMGLFNVILGSTTPIPDSLFANGERWIGITVDSDPEMAPRMKITSVPWALRAAVADSVLNGSGGNTLDQAYDQGGPGVGRTIDVDAGGVVLDATANGEGNPALLIQGDDLYEPGIELDNDSQTWRMHVQGTGEFGITKGVAFTPLRIASNSFNNELVLTTDGVGIGINTPAEMLEVDGAIRVGNTTNSNMGTIRWTGSDFEGYDGGAWISFTSTGSGMDNDWTVSGADMYSAVSGNVGVATSDPKAPFHVGSGETVLFGADTTGVGARLMWLPGQLAFRVGRATGTEWDPDSTGMCSFASGYATLASGRDSNAMGRSNRAVGIGSVAMGAYTEARNDYSIAVGSSSIAASNFAIAMGNHTRASGLAAVALGNRSEARGIGSVALGNEAIAGHDYAVAAGFETRAEGYVSTALGQSTTASGSISFAVGQGCEASGFASTALGGGTTASGNRAFAAGNTTVASGHGSAAFGTSTTASASDALATGYNAAASGNASTAMGYGLKAEAFSTAAFGRYNIGGGTPSSWILTDPAFEIGIGTSDIIRKNAMTVLKSGYVGIGTHAPSYPLQLTSDESTRTLDVTNTHSLGVSQTVNFERTVDPSSENDIVQIKTPDTAPDDFQFIECERGTDVKFKVNGDGNLYADGTLSGPADFAEMIEVSSGAGTVEPGDVIVIDANNPRATEKSYKPRSTLVAGIYSAKPGFLGSERDWEKPSEGQGGEAGTYSLDDMASEFNEIPLAVVGIVPCKVSAENGPIRPGDLLVTSSTPGHAMRDDAPIVGTVVGKALDSLTSGTGVIKVLVTLQ
jgi:hypothetical protein